jgi:hypothetical protein
MNNGVQQTIVLSANSSEAMTPRKGAGKKSMVDRTPKVRQPPVGSRRRYCEWTMFQADIYCGRVAA